MAWRALLLWCAVILGSAEASSAAALHDETVQNAMEDFARQRPQCRTLTDGCIICAIAGLVFTCSTPQTACVQKAFSCTEPREADKAE